MPDWEGKGKYPPEQERERQRMIKEAKEARLFRKRLRAIRDKLQTSGENSLTAEERAIVDQRRDYFFPED